jgi:hypothetical protein
MQQALAEETRGAFNILCERKYGAPVTRLQESNFIFLSKPLSNEQ